MADEQDEGIGSTFPVPPPFCKHFTTDNLARLKELRENAQGEGSGAETSEPGTSSLRRVLDLPPELRFLIPPEPPTDGKWRNFGGQYDLSDPLPSLNDLQLYPSGPDEDPLTIPSEWTLDRAFYLKKIAKSILLNFLELVGTLSINPDQFEEKTQDLRVLFINAHHLINQYRPHQARETLILMMEEQVERTRAQVEGEEDEGRD
ncbi:Mediator of RNA polymerase II transcription subunit 7 [Coniosporium tulheliwenetii]|uniref:Mediator of RNA polymerase II transcription subunit 7 n=1 Tax=Coniosporium tulheliwenetii TaxID=3383036 RepID=A0ACC2YZ94_9PEZI|nr:Mediator of RNA polymerase II transcription subunit 7 [Cladosporium sp. JES 115]